MKVVARQPSRGERRRAVVTEISRTKEREKTQCGRAPSTTSSSVSLTERIRNAASESSLLKKLVCFQEPQQRSQSSPPAVGRRALQPGERRPVVPSVLGYAESDFTEVEEDNEEMLEFRRKEQEVRAFFATEHLPLHYVLQDYSLSHKFRTFITEQHASENLLFYLAVERFKKHKYTTQSNVPLQEILKEASQAPRKKKTTVNSTQMHMNMARNLQLAMSRVGVIMDALKIYGMFLQDGAGMWVCVSPQVLEEISEVLLKEPQKTTQDIFDKASKEAYVTMEKDVLPRFLAAANDKITIERLHYYVGVLQKKKQKQQPMLSFAESFKRSSITFMRRLSTRAPSTVSSTR